jgi:hypothetical protein
MTSPFCLLSPLFSCFRFSRPDIRTLITRPRSHAANTSRPPCPYTLRSISKWNGSIPGRDPPPILTATLPPTAMPPIRQIFEIRCPQILHDQARKADKLAAVYEPDCLQNVEASMCHKPMSPHGLLQR